MSIFTIKINSFEMQNEWGEPTVSTYWYAEYEATVIFSRKLLSLKHYN